jgi:hypothetical protein
LCPLFGICAVTLVFLLLAQPVLGQQRAGDRFGIRGGIWPQPELDGTLGQRKFWPTAVEPLDARVREASVIAPFFEGFGLLNIRNSLWFEGALGYSQRRDVQVWGVALDGDSAILLGEGRIDLFPVFAGVRFIAPLGNPENGHNVYARAGGSIVFANESPSYVRDSVSFYGLYSSGTEAAFGFALGAGGEYYITRRTGITVDAQYRYTNFSYGRKSDFDLSAIWIGAGIIYRTR